MANTNHFRVIVSEKKSILEKLHDTWLKTSENPSIPDIELCFIRSVLGQSQLLLKKKFNFMENFLTRADEEKELNVNNNDLEGLWDVICIEVDDLNAKFKYLETIKANNWKRPTPALKSPKITKKRKQWTTQRNLSVTSQKELVKSVRSVPTGTNTSRDLSNRPKPSLTKLVEALPRRSGHIETNTVNIPPSRSKPLSTKQSQVPNRRPNSSTQSGLIETNTINTKTSRPQSSTAKPSQVPCRRPNSLTRSGLLEPNTAGTPTSTPKLSSTKSCGTTYRRPNLSTRSGLLEPNTAGTRTNLPARTKSCKTTYRSIYSAKLPGLTEKNSSSSSTRVIPLKSIQNKMLIKSNSPQEQIVIAPIISDNEDEFFDAKSSLSVD